MWFDVGMSWGQRLSECFCRRRCPTQLARLNLASFLSHRNLEFLLVPKLFKNNLSSSTTPLASFKDSLDSLTLPFQDARQSFISISSSLLLILLYLIAIRDVSLLVTFQPSSNSMTPFCWTCHSIFAVFLIFSASGCIRDSLLLLLSLTFDVASYLSYLRKRISSLTPHASITTLNFNISFSVANIQVLSLSYSSFYQWHFRSFGDPLRSCMVTRVKKHA